LGQLTKKADIYSFGVLLLEVISGESSSKSTWGEDLHVLVEWVTHFPLSFPHNHQSLCCINSFFFEKTQKAFAFHFIEKKESLLLLRSS
jgi:hypothetical protein